jgi:hypothetical protein
MMPVALDLLGGVGATMILVRGTIFARVRAWAPSFLGCALCVGFWSGLLFAAARGARDPLDLFVLACATSLLSFFAILIVYKLEG